VIRGDKPGTVRQINSKRPVRSGDNLYIFTGMRTKKCKRHGSHYCQKVYPIKIDWKTKTITLDGVQLIPIVRHWFATTDIQGSEQDFFDFFEKMKYQKPLVWIVWDIDTAMKVDEWLKSEREVEQLRKQNNVLKNSIATVYESGRNAERHKH
jgi:hypothetical protein